MTLTKQHAAFLDQALRQRMNAAISRHAVYLKNKTGPAATAPELAWADAVLGNQFAQMLDRVMRFTAAMPTVYQAANLASLSDDALLAIAADAQAKLPPLSIEERAVRG